MSLFLHKDFIKSYSKLQDYEKYKVRNTIEKIKSEVNLNSLRLHKVGSYWSYSCSKKIRLLGYYSKDKKILMYVDNHDTTYQWGDTHASASFTSDSIVSINSSEFNYSNLNEDYLLNSQYYNIIEAKTDSILNDMLSKDFQEWLVFLHPTQKYIVDMPIDESLVVCGGPGTGKTITLAHRFRKMYEYDQNIIFLSLSPTTSEVLKNTLECLMTIDTSKHLFNIKELTLKDKELLNFINQYSIIFIDEAQDMPLKFLSKFISFIENKLINTTFVIAYDLNQSIHTAAGEGLKRLDNYSNKVVLNYSYRFTDTISTLNRSILNTLHTKYVGRNFQQDHKVNSCRDEITSVYYSTIRGPEIEVTCVSEQSLILTKINDYVLNLQSKYGENLRDFTIIYLGDDIDLFNRLILKYRVVKASKSKGLEFLYGVVIDTNDIYFEINSENKYVTNEQYYKLLNECYVALSRFRNEFIVMYLHSSSIFNTKEFL